MILFNGCTHSPQPISHKPAEPLCALPHNIENDIEYTFKQNVRSISTLYSRSLRDNPYLTGKIILVITVEPDGTAGQVDFLSNTLNDRELERKLFLTVMSFKFCSGNINPFTFNYPIEFLPN